MKEEIKRIEDKDNLIIFYNDKSFTVVRGSFPRSLIDPICDKLYGIGIPFKDNKPICRN